MPARTIAQIERVHEIEIEIGEVVDRGHAAGSSLRPKPGCEGASTRNDRARRSITGSVA
jgi:hypothetical protein